MAVVYRSIVDSFRAGREPAPWLCLNCHKKLRTPGKFLCEDCWGKVQRDARDNRELSQDSGK